MTKLECLRNDEDAIQPAKANNIRHSDFVLL